jgi:hypothetical protein
MLWIWDVDPVSRIPDPDFYPARVPDPIATTKEKGKNLVVFPFFVITNFTKLKFYFIFEHFSAFY